MSDENKQAKQVQDYLLMYFSSQLKDKASSEVQKLLAKVANELGAAAFGNLITGSFPGAALAKAGSGMLKFLWFEGYFIVNTGMNPYDPVSQQDEYVEYLLYSWARGEPGYKYNDLKGLGQTVHH